jgi:uncharacterized lipoprotein YddW (UPF0748 family)
VSYLRRSATLLFAATVFASTMGFQALSAPPPATPQFTAGVPRLQWAHDRNMEMRLLWLDATANLERLSTREGVQRILDKAVQAGFNAVGVGVKSPCGYVLYNSRIAPRMGNFMGRYDYPKDYDLLQTVTEEAHKRGLEVHALVMIFSDGRKINKSGPAYNEHAAWQSIQYLKDGRRVKQADAKGGTFVFLNPALQETQNYEISILKEIARNYNVDGIAVDRCRYSGLDADFSDASRKAFERYIGHPVARFPQDILTWAKNGGPNPGRYFKKWLEFRASVIGGFVRRAAKAVHQTRPGVKFGSVVGAWYPTYINEGVNWGSVRFNPGKEWPWATATYRKTGYADAIDYLVPNCYSATVDMDEAEDAGHPAWRSVEGGAQIARQAVSNACWIYGGVYAFDYRGKPQDFVRAIQAVKEDTNGVMAFDVSQIEDYGWWPLFREVFHGSTRPPHESETVQVARRK